MRTWSVIAVTVATVAGCHRKPAPPPGPRGDCAKAADLLASLELGNYAEPDARAPVVAKYGDACHDAELTVSEVACMQAATDSWAAKTCAPRMFPEMADSHDDGACKALIDRLRASLLTGLDPKLAAWATTELDVEQTACVEDAWPDAIKACMLAGSGGGACKAGLPEPLQRKLQARLQTAFAEATK